MISKLNLVTFIMALVAASSFSSIASAEHLKVHVHQDKSHQGHHQKLLGFGDEDSRKSDSPEYLKRNFGDIYAICNFWHEGASMNWFSIGFFDEDGSLLKRFCNEKGEIKLGNVKEYSNNINDWEEVKIDEQSVCLLHASEAKGAVDLMTSYNCKSWYEFWK